MGGNTSNFVEREPAAVFDICIVFILGSQHFVYACCIFFVCINLLFIAFLLLFFTDCIIFFLHEFSVAFVFFLCLCVVVFLEYALYVCLQLISLFAAHFHLFATFFFLHLFCALCLFCALF